MAEVNPSVAENTININSPLKRQKYSVGIQNIKSGNIVSIKEE